MEFQEYFPFWEKLTAQQQEMLDRAIVFTEVKSGTRIHDSSAD